MAQYGLWDTMFELFVRGPFETKELADVAYSLYTADDDPDDPPARVVEVREIQPGDETDWD